MHLHEKQTDYTNARKAFLEDASILVLMLLSLTHTLHSSLTSAAVGSHAVDSTACADMNRSIWLQEGKRRGGGLFFLSVQPQSLQIFVVVVTVHVPACSI